MFFKYFSRQILFSRTSQEGPVYSSTFQACANPAVALLFASGLQIRVCIGKLFSLYLIQNICCGYSKEPSQCDGSFEHPKHMFQLIGKKIITILRS